MKRHIKDTLLLFAMLLCIAVPAMAQHETSGAGHNDAFEPKHSLGLTIGHARAFEGRDAEGNRKVLALPFIGFDYNFHFAPKWFFGLHADLITETFEVKKTLGGRGAEEVVERKNPFAPAAMIFYKPGHRWSAGLGLGAEFASEENYLLTRASVEYAVPIRKGWEVFGGIQYDFRWKAYDTWTFGLGISKELGKSHED